MVFGCPVGSEYYAPPKTSKGDERNSDTSAQHYISCGVSLPDCNDAKRRDHRLAPARPKLPEGSPSSIFQSHSLRRPPNRLRVMV